MTVFRSVIEQVRERTDIVQVIGSRTDINGSNKAICPFHDDHTPSLSVHPKKQFFYCFGCGVGGDVFRFLELYDKKPFMDVLTELAGQVHVELNNLSSDSFKVYETQRTIAEILDETVRFYQKSLTEKVRSHLVDERGFTHETIQRFRIGYARGSLKKHLIEVKDYPLEACIQAGVLRGKESKDAKDFFYNRIIFPNIVHGRVVHLTGRSFDNSEPKYLHLLGKIEYYFNENSLLNDDVLIVEGPTDCIAAEQSGFPSLALLGSRGIRTEDLSKFRKCKRIYICLDGDKSGKEGAGSAAQILGERAKIVSLPDGFDVCDYLHKNDATDFRELLDSAKNQVEIDLEAIPLSIDKVALPDSLQPILVTLATYSEPRAEAYLTHRIQPRFDLTDEEVHAYRNQLTILAVKDKASIQKSKENQTLSDSSVSILTTIDCNELLNRDFNEPELVSNGILSPGRSLLLIGAPKSGKTMLALNLAVALSKGTNWLGFDIPAPQNVLYLSAEGGPALLQNRIRNMIAPNLETKGKLTFWWPDKEQMAVDDPDSLTRLIATINHLQVTVFIIDPLIRFHSADENNSKEMTCILKNLETIRAKTKAALVIVHHSRKTGMSSKPGSAQEARGSSVLTGDVDSVVSLEQDRKKGEFKIDFTLRWAPEPDTLRLTLNEDTLTFEVKESDEEASNKVTDKRLLGMINELGECTTTDLNHKTKIPDRTIRRALKRLESEKQISHRNGPKNSNIWSSTSK